VTVVEIPDSVAESVESLAERSMRLDCTIQEGQVWLAANGETIHFDTISLQCT
jgi:uncharacterized protein YaeQ